MPPDPDATLQDLMSKWLQPTVYDRDGLANQVLLEQFLADLKEGTQHWVRHHMPQNSKVPSKHLQSLKRSTEGEKQFLGHEAAGAVTAR